MGAQIGILVIGTEILDGIIQDTNTKWIINRLKPLNFNVKESITVRDNTAEIARALNRLIDDGCKFVFTTGGLGPTHDDMTLKGVAEAFDLPLDLNEDALAIVTRQYKILHKRGIIHTGKITDARRKMAVLPQGAIPLDNRAGGAPGVLLPVEDSQVICLPGVPFELMWIFDNQVMPLLKNRVEGIYFEKILYYPLRDESTLAPIIDQVMKEVPNVYIKSMVKPYGESGIRLWISARGQNQTEVENRVDRVAKLLEEKTKTQLS
ncbi:MAG: competence/damage-inducible protein A [Promethearchaeota archaeon]|jgi:molybdenum cofactor synthesis domain-containing protein